MAGQVTTSFDKRDSKSKPLCGLSALSTVSLLLDLIREEIQLIVFFKIPFNDTISELHEFMGHVISPLTSNLITKIK